MAILYGHCAHNTQSLLIELVQGQFCSHGWAILAIALFFLISKRLLSLITAFIKTIKFKIQLNMRRAKSYSQQFHWFIHQIKSIYGLKIRKFQHFAKCLAINEAWKRSFESFQDKEYFLLLFVTWESIIHKQITRKCNFPYVYYLFAFYVWWTSTLFLLFRSSCITKLQSCPFGSQ